MKKKWIYIAISFILIILIILLVCYLRVRFAKIEVLLNQNTQIPVRSIVKYSDCILSMNGELLEDELIDTSSLGVKDITIHFKNEDGIKVKYTFQVEVIDNTPPIVWLRNDYTVSVGSSPNIFDKIMCADDYDSNPNCMVKGEYDLNEVGVYPLTFVATDQSGNQFQKDFRLHVQEPPKNTSSSTNNNHTPVYTEFQDVLLEYKNDDTEVGLDISHWQGDVDYEALKASGVEFVFLRVGTSDGIDGEQILDKKFLQNIKSANEVGIPVGIYFYSYANTEDRAISDAKWVINQIKDYHITLPIAFDWGNWNTFNEFHLSLFGLTDIANAFLKVVEDAGYEGMLYSSKSYLEQVWYPTSYKTWLAHYTDRTNYQGDYEFWQMCSDGSVNGIKGAVDINIRYKK